MKYVAQSIKEINVEYVQATSPGDDRITVMTHNPVTTPQDVASVVCSILGEFSNNDSETYLANLEVLVGTLSGRLTVVRQDMREQAPDESSAMVDFLLQPYMKEGTAPYSFKDRVGV